MTITLTGQQLTIETVEALGSQAEFVVDPAAASAVERAAHAARAAASVRPVYGWTSGVGANRDQTSTSAHPGRALLRSHAAGWGDLFPAQTVRSALAIRLNQVLAGASGASAALVRALVAATGADDGQLPLVHRRGAIGTSDLTALAEVGLTIVGERPRADGTYQPPLDIDDADALPLMSSSAFTLAEAALGCGELERLAQVAMTVCALSFVALRGNAEAFGPVVAKATPFPGAVTTATVVSRLLQPNDVEPSQLQDFFGLRTYPQVHGPLLDQVENLRRVVETLVNTGSENPAVTSDDPPTVAHHGGFHQAYLALAVDAALIALVGSAQTGLSRIAHLLTDPASGLPRFLAAPEAGSSGLLILEYNAASAIAVLREAASVPSSIHSSSVSAGVEDDASHASVRTARLPEVAAAYQQLIALELVSAVRAIRISGQTVRGDLSDLLARCGDLTAEDADHDLAPTLAAAVDIVSQYARDTWTRSA